MKSHIMAQAWQIARETAERQGGSPKTYLPAAMRLAEALVQHQEAIGATQQPQSPKEIAADLEGAAHHAVTIGLRPATRRQVWRLANLLSDRGETARSIGITGNECLTTAGASTWIARLEKSR